MTFRSWAVVTWLCAIASSGLAVDLSSVLQVDFPSRDDRADSGKRQSRASIVGWRSRFARARFSGSIVGATAHQAAADWPAAGARATTSNLTRVHAVRPVSNYGG